jgi:hypothetical protein
VAVLVSGVKSVPPPSHPPPAPFERCSEDFKWGLYDYGVHLTDEEFDMVLGFFDRNGDGKIDFTEFLVTLRGELNEHRLSFIREVRRGGGEVGKSGHFPWFMRARRLCTEPRRRGAAPCPL